MPMPMRPQYQVGIEHGLVEDLCCHMMTDLMAMARLCTGLAEKSEKLLQHVQAQIREQQRLECPEEHY